MYQDVTTPICSGESSTPFCAEVKSSPLKTGCTYERTGVAICNLQMFSESLPPVYQLFSLQPELGGKVSIADYCPYMQVGLGVIYSCLFYCSILSLSQGWNQADARASVKKICLNYFWSASSK